VRDMLTALPEDDWAVPKLLLNRYGVLCDRLAFLIIRPEAVQQGYSLRILERTAELGFTVVAAEIIRPHPRQLEELYRYTQLRLMDAGDRLLWSYTPRYYLLGPAVAVLLKGNFGNRTAAKVLNEAKGPSNPVLTVPGQLRYDFGSQNPVMCVIHSSDDTEAMMREASLFFDRETLDRVISAGPVGAVRHVVGPVEAVRHLVDVEELLVAEGLSVYPRPRSFFHQVLARVQADIIGRLNLSEDIGTKLAESVKRLLTSMVEGELTDLSYMRRTSALLRLWESEKARRLLQIADENDDLGAFLSWSARLEHTGRALMDRVIAVLRARGVDIDQWDEITLDTGFGFHSLIIAHFASPAV
jgi:nucleoside diphosphate kinase